MSKSAKIIWLGVLSMAGLIFAYFIGTFIMHGQGSWWHPPAVFILSMCAFMCAGGLIGAMTGLVCKVKDVINE